MHPYWPNGRPRRMRWRPTAPALEEWPRSWMYEERDLSPGQRVVEYFKPFLHYLLRSELSRKTLRKHRDNLWLLGGELILDLHEGSRLSFIPSFLEIKES